MMMFYHSYRIDITMLIPIIYILLLLSNPIQGITNLDSLSSYPLLVHNSHYVPSLTNTNHHYERIKTTKSASSNTFYSNEILETRHLFLSHLFNKINNGNEHNHKSFVNNKLLLSIRGGSSEEEEEEEEEKEGEETIKEDITEENDSNYNQKQDQQQRKHGHKYFGLIHSVFQMNMDAKDELILTEGNDNVSTASSRYLDNDDDYDEEIDNLDDYDDEEIEIETIVHEPNTSIRTDVIASGEDTEEIAGNKSQRRDEIEIIENTPKKEMEVGNETLPSIHDIVKEEWDMIPETEVEDESDEFDDPKRRDRIRSIDALQQQEKEQRRIEREKRKLAREEKRRNRELERKQMNENDELKANSVISSERSVSPESEEIDRNDESIIMKRNTTSDILQQKSVQSYISSGWWETIDAISSLGFSEGNENLRISKKLYKIRKKAAELTGLHGILSGKGHSNKFVQDRESELDDEQLGRIRQRLKAIELARKRVAATTQQASSSEIEIPRWRRIFARRRLIVNNSNNFTGENATALSELDDKSTPLIMTKAISTKPKSEEEMAMLEALREEEIRRIERVKEIDSLIKEGQRKILELQCQKDDLQRRPNPLFKYSNPGAHDWTDTNEKSIDSKSEEKEEHSFASGRRFNFPPSDLVSEYLEELQSNGRLQKLNHTELWSSGTNSDDDEEESIGDDLLTPSGDAKKLYENKNEDRKRSNNDRRNGGNLGGGSWFLRQNLLLGGSLGEKIGVAMEEAAYKGVCTAMMSILARSLASLHGVNVMQHSDIRLFVESTPDLPPVSKAMYSSSSVDYTREAIGKAIRKGSKKKRKKKQKPYQYGSHISDDTFIQRDAVVETLISHCQISAPLLKLFPSEWQRALLGNIITLVAAVVSDFCDGVQFQILGHQLSFSFKPITEADMIQHIGVGGFRFNHRRTKPEEFEAAVRATADDISNGLTFLDRWHERALGGDLLKAQIGNLIARLVLTLVDEVLHSARMDLWSAQVAGPRVVAGLEYRVEDM